MLSDMRHRASGGLNDSGEDAGTCIVRGGAAHLSRSQQTSRHAHNAWKLHIGLDAPVWLETETGVRRQAQALLVPPNSTHVTGSVGWSLAVFAAPGAHGAAWMGDHPRLLEGRAAEAVVRRARQYESLSGTEVRHLIAELCAVAVPRSGATPDARVVTALDTLARSPGASGEELGARVRLSGDRISRLVVRQTGLPLRRHRLWIELLRALGSARAAPTLTAAAHQAGFADQAHLTRTCRAFLGRCPSGLSSRPVVVEPWL